MNIIHIRDMMKRMKDIGVISQKMLHDLTTGPVFIYPYREKGLEPQELDWAVENIMGGEKSLIPRNLPYQTFTLFQPSGLKDKYKDDEELKGHDIGPTVRFVISGAHRLPSLPDRLFLFTVVSADELDGREMVTVASYNGETHKGSCLMAWIDGKQQDMRRLEGHEDLFKPMYQMPRQTVVFFAFDVMSYFCVTMKVSPKNTPGKSAEWHLGRTHYLVLGRKQAEHCRAHRRGPTGEEVVMAAHWRRAHFRKLMSPKFKHKMGMAVPVRQAWVGPSIFEGLDGKIYKIMQ